MPALRQRRRHVPFVVVVAEDREDAVRRVQRRQQLRDGLDECPIAERDVVAAEDDQVGPLRHERSTAALTSSAGTMRAVMNVGHQPDPQAVERGRQPGDRKRGVGDADPMAFVARRRTAAAPVDRSRRRSASRRL